MVIIQWASKSGLSDSKLILFLIYWWGFLWAALLGKRLAKWGSSSWGRWRMMQLFSGKPREHSGNSFEAVWPAWGTIGSMLLYFFPSITWIPTYIFRKKSSVSKDHLGSCLVRRGSISLPDVRWKNQKFWPVDGSRSWVLSTWWLLNTGLVWPNEPGYTRDQTSHS